MSVCAFRYAVVTGSNKGIGLETVKGLASNGIKVVLTARDERRGSEAIEKLKECGLSDLVVFHQLDVTDHASIASLVDFVKTQFGRLDILVRRHADNTEYSELLRFFFHFLTFSFLSYMSVMCMNCATLGFCIALIGRGSYYENYCHNSQLQFLL